MSDYVYLFHVVMSMAISAWKRGLARLYLQLFVGGPICVCLYIAMSNTTWFLWAIQRVSYKRQELLTLREYLCSPPVFGGHCVGNRFSFLSCVVLLCLSLSCILCTQCYQCFWVVYSWLPLRFSLTFIYYLLYVLYLVYPTLPVFLDCPFLIAPSVFSNAYFLPTVYTVSYVPNDARVSGLSIHDYSFGFL